MIVFTTKLTRRKVVSVILVVCIIICSAVVLIRDSDSSDTVSVSEQEVTLNDKKIKTNEERVALLVGYGWEVDEEPLEFMEVKIPEKFDGVYLEYNEIQKRQGFDLEKYAGKRVMRYTYKVNNHQSNEEGVVANIIVYKNKLIAGDVCSPKLGGFMHGLSENSVTNESQASDGDNGEKAKEQE